MFVLIAYFCRELRFVAILRSKLRFLLKNTGVDSDFTQNFWGKNWRLKALLPTKNSWGYLLLNQCWDCFSKRIVAHVEDWKCQFPDLSMTKTVVDNLAYFACFRVWQWQKMWAQSSTLSAPLSLKRWSFSLLKCWHDTKKLSKYDQRSVYNRWMYDCHQVALTLVWILEMFTLLPKEAMDFLVCLMELKSHCNRGFFWIKI